MNTLLKSDNTGIDKLGRVGMLISRLVIGYLWFDQLLWKLPPPANGIGPMERLPRSD